MHSKLAHHHTLTPNHLEWVSTWESLFQLTASYTDHKPRCRDLWRYTDTVWKGRPAIGSLHPLRVLVREFRRRGWAEMSQPNGGGARHNGHIVLHLSTSIEYSGDWTRPLREGSFA